VRAPGSSTAVRFGLAALGAWRVSHLLTAEDGPGGAIALARGRLGHGPLGELADCFGCLSMWVCVPFVPLVTRRRDEAVACWLGLCGAAFLLERVSGGPEPGPERVIRLEPEGEAG
jgi:hypothetical protein